MFKVILINVLLLATCKLSLGQNNEYQFSQLDITNGLSNNRVNSIFKDAQGFMWFGTASGLSRYDGYEFKVFRHSATDENSLFSNYVEKIYLGPGNKMWVFTNNGISIYDPVHEKFQNDISHELELYHINARFITAVKQDGDGNFWFLTRGDGLFRYEPSTRKTSVYNTAKGAGIPLHSNSVSDIVAGENRSLWIIYRDGVVDKTDGALHKLLGRSYELNRQLSGKELRYQGTADGDNLWLYVAESEYGIFCLDQEKKLFSHLVKSRPGISLNSNVINSIVKGDDNKLWIGTDHGGINLIDRNRQVSYLINKPDDPKSLRGNSVVLYKDNTGIIWAGTTKQGISYFHKGIIQFPLVKHYILNNNSLPYEDVDCFVEDKGGNLWIGTNGGGLLFYNNRTKKYSQFRHDPANPASLSNDIVISLCIDHTGTLWAGTYFGGLERLKDGKFIHYLHHDNQPGSISDDRVYTIMEDSQERLWVGTFTGGLNIYDREHNDFRHPQYSSVSDYTEIIFEDKDKNIWIGRDKGIDVISHATGLIKHYTYKPHNKNSLIANDVNCITQTNDGLMWIGTKDGISILNTATGSFTSLQEKQGLPSNNVWGIIQDNKGVMWVSSANGIVSIKRNSLSPNGYQISKYNEFDGLQGHEFNANASFRLSNGNIIFGGPHGYNLFNPLKIESSGLKPDVVFTDFQLFNKSVKVGDTINGKVILTRSISKTPSVVLGHNQNDFSITFAALDYYNPGKIDYQYKLEGFDKNWLASSNTSRTATYTNLDAGDYTFTVKAVNNNAGISGEASVKVKILPPFWKTPLFYCLYALLAIGLLFYIRHRGIMKLRREFKASQDKLEAERINLNEKEAARRMHDLDMMKIKFFTNVSHEFRTPLSLIISPIDTLIQNSHNTAQQDQLLMIKRNSRRLLNLVNQLLDFRKMESRELRLNLSEGDIIRFIKEVASSFTDLAGQNHIGFITYSEVDSLITNFDHDKIERILFNLLSNAFKFTHAGGHVSVLMQVIAGTAETPQILEIRVSDSGIGIPKEKLSRVFDRFYQVSLPENMLNQGSGIGLSITSEFVKMHSGEITVESEPGNGSCFIIKLPVVVSDKPAPVVETVYEDEMLLQDQRMPVPETNKKPIVLIVDDNDDLRFYLKENLKGTFNITEARNGREGWQKALALHPHVIVSDVNMPEMNGLELCKKIRNDNRTSHIPLILLTALTEEEHQLAGLATGANDYISKPFNFEILASKINGLLAMQEAFKRTYQKQREINVNALEIVSEDEKFLKNVFDIIEKNITNYNFSVEELSRQMSLSRVSLYKRLLALTGKTPVDCIRTIRLKRAVQLLEKSKLSIASIAYEVGFNNPTYFSKVFKDEYGVVPSEYFNALKEKKEKEPLESH